MNKEADFAVPTREVLEEASLARFNHQPVSEEARKLVSDLMSTVLEVEGIKATRSRTRSPLAVNNLRHTIGAMIYDLLRASRNGGAWGFCYRPESTLSFTTTCATYRQYRAVRQQWKDLDLLDHARITKSDVEMNAPRFAAPGVGLRHVPRLRATPKLLGIAKEHGVTPEALDDHFKPAHRASSPVALNKRPIPIKMRTPELEGIAAKVEAVNDFLARQVFTPTMTPELTAMFNDHPTAPGEAVSGGRLYSRSKDSFQQLPKAARLAMTINGESVAELDVKGSHLTIFLGRQGVQLEEGRDPYAVPGVPREIVKHLVTAMFGKGHRGISRWPQLSKDDPKDAPLREARKGRTATDDVAAILEAIPELKKLPTKKGLNSLKVSGTLQKIEASAILETLMELMENHGIASLPVHDSVIVPASKADLAAGVLSRRFKAAAKVYPTLVIRGDGAAERSYFEPAQGRT